MTPAPAPIRCVLGMRGFGKSTVARRLVADRRRLLVYDSRREHQAIALPLDYSDFENYVDAAAADDFARPFRVALIEESYEEDFCALAWVVGVRLRGAGVTVLIDEADLVAQPGRETRIFKRLAAQGRHEAIELIACARRPVELSRFVTAFADEFYLCRTQEPDDLRFLRSIVGADAAAAVAELPKFQCVRWTLDGWAVHEIAPDGALHEGARHS